VPPVVVFVNFTFVPVVIASVAGLSFVTSCAFITTLADWLDFSLWPFEDVTSMKKI
jgi:hypothetical protein